MTFTFTTCMVLPRRATAGNAGYDVFAEENIVIKKGETVKVGLPFLIQGEKNYKVAIYLRSSLSIKKGIHLGEDEALVTHVSANLNEPVTFELVNRWNEDVVIGKGEHYVQIVVGSVNCYRIACS